jgi:tetratricopeptide (TPR) repeat protein
MNADAKSSDAMLAYAMGQAAFERGQYREATDSFQQALALSPANSELGGAIQIWLVTAYDAAGQREEALDLCRQLRTHGDYDTRQQSKRLLYILEAPKLQSRPEWLTQIPDLSQAEVNRDRQVGRTGQTQAKPSAVKGIEPFEPIDPKESRGFLGLALGVSALVLLALWWMGQVH